MRLLRRVRKSFDDLPGASSAAQRAVTEIGPVADRVKASAHGLAESAAHAVDAATGWFSRRSKKMGLDHGIAGEASRLVGAHPFKSLAVVFVAGVLLAKAMR